MSAVLDYRIHHDTIMHTVIFVEYLEIMEQKKKNVTGIQLGKVSAKLLFGSSVQVF